MRILKEYDKLDNTASSSRSVRRSLAALLLSASRFSDAAWKRETIERAGSLLADDDDCYLKAWFTHRSSAISRLYGQPQDSQKILEDFVRITVYPGHDQHLGNDSRWNAQRGELVVSFSENLIQKNQLSEAKQELLAWQPLNPEIPSTMECLVQRVRNTNLGRIFREEGNFDEALRYLLALLQNAATDSHYDHTGWLCISVSNIADLFCELDRGVDALKILEPKIATLAERKVVNFGIGRRLQICMVEALIISSRFEEAEVLLWNQKFVHELVTEPDVLTRVTFFRTWYGLARLTHVRHGWKQALEHWKLTLEKGKECKWKENEYPMNVVRLSMGHVLLELGNVDDGLKMVEEAKLDLGRESPKYWMVGVGTYWLKYVETQLQNRLGVLERSGSVGTTWSQDTMVDKT